jgi:Pyruvate/2-oxoacid:ferredoxin oxidoreductase delta subunit
MKFEAGQRVFDTDCGEFGTVIEQISKTKVKVEYDHDWGCDTAIDTCPVKDLELAQMSKFMRKVKEK